ncbi:hypothetical protein [Microbacterium lacus]|uniref:hypothetical protein n=1 Tax=Microbacterium lacus TaxID=415217 RepID=UPI000C2B5711|nr:hypothetical protein [Microbacterium lacus]
MNISQYGKSIAYILASLFGILAAAVSDGIVTLEEALNIGIIVIGAIGVYWAPNVPGGALAYFKGVVAFLVAGLVAAVAFATGGISPAEWLQVFVAALAGIGVVIIPNETAKSLPVANAYVEHPAV